jgi:hypothetical protein
MLEKLIADLIAALNANTAARLGESGAASTATAAETKAPAAGKGGKTGTAKTDVKKDEPKGPTVEEMQAALSKVKEEQGAAVAKKIISDVAGVAKMAEIPADKVKAVFDAATKALAGETVEEGDDDI